jgi:hypothetical protein
LVPRQDPSLGTATEGKSAIAIELDLVDPGASRHGNIPRRELAKHPATGVDFPKTEGVDKETIQETVRREDVDVDESGKTARLEKSNNEEKL